MKVALMKLVKTFFLITVSGMAMAEVKVIVHPSVIDGDVSAEQVADVFLGKTNSLPSGHKMVPVDQAEAELSRKEFYSKVAKKDTAQLKAYWSRLIFTGKGQPPKELSDDTEVLQLVSANPNIVGYVSGAVNTSKVKVLLTID